MLLRANVPLLKPPRISTVPAGSKAAATCPFGWISVRQPVSVAVMDIPALSGARSTMAKLPGSALPLMPMTMQSPADSGTTGGNGGTGADGGLGGDAGGSRSEIGGGGDGCGGGGGGESACLQPQSVQSVADWQDENSEPGPPSSQSPSRLYIHSSLHWDIRKRNCYRLSGARARVLRSSFFEVRHTRRTRLRRARPTVSPPVSRVQVSREAFHSKCELISLSRFFVP
eukprot:6005991-Prymnesium_polylepis.1